MMTTLNKIISTQTTQNFQDLDTQQIDLGNKASTIISSALTDQVTNQGQETATQRILTNFAQNVTSAVDSVTSKINDLFSGVSSSVETTTKSRIILTDSSNSNSTVFSEVTDGNRTSTEIGTTVSTLLDNITTQTSINSDTIRDAITTSTQKAITTTGSATGTSTIAGTVFENLTQPTAISDTVRGIFTNTTETVTDATTEGMADLTTTSSTLLENVTVESNTVTETVRDFITTTTEKVIGVTNSITRNITPNETYSTESPEHLNADNSSLVVYIIIGVLLAILLILFVSLYVFYKRRKTVDISNGYYVTQLRDVSGSSSKASCNMDQATVKL